MEKRLIFIPLVLVFYSGIIFACIFGKVFPSLIVQNLPLHPDSYELNMDSSLYYRQTINNCGPYSVMAVLNILKGENHDPEQLATNTKYRIYKNLTLPQGVAKLLSDNGIFNKSFILKSQSDKAKITWLKNTVSSGKPVILLIKVHHVLHYVTVLGFDENGFMLYDSMQEKQLENSRMTIDDFSEKCGNRYYSAQELISMWNDGGYKCFYRNLAIVC